MMIYIMIYIININVSLYKIIYNKLNLEMIKLEMIFTSRDEKSKV